MNWERRDRYYAECETHRISRAWMGDFWAFLLYDKRTREYVDRRIGATQDEQERAVAALKGVADEALVSR